MPAEWSNHDCCWMQWPTDVTGDYSEIESWAHFDLEKARVAWANVANAISKFEDLIQLSEIGCEAAIVGKAIYENRISLKEIENFILKNA